MSRKGTVAKFPGGNRPEWVERLSRNRDGEVKPTMFNLQLILENDAELKGLFALDEFANRIVLKRDPPWTGASRTEFTEIDGTELSAWLGRPEQYSLNAKTNMVLECVEAIARRYRFHPVRDYLNGLRHDGVERVASLFVEHFGAEDTPYTRAVARIFMVSAVARIFEPGCKVDTMVIFEGAQGAGKTRVTRALFGTDWYAEAMESPASKDFYQALAGRWGVEIGEMESFTKAEVNRVKQALSAQDDTYRASYARYARKHPRQCLFIGTTNDDHYLRDPTGARRFLPVKVGQIAVDRVIELRDQLWAEAAVMYRTGEAYWKLPEQASAQQEERYFEDSWTELIVRWLSGREWKEDGKTHPPSADWRKGGKGGLASTTIAEVLLCALALDRGKHGRPEQMRVASILKRLGWRQRRVVFNDEQQRRWYRPEEDGDDPIPF